MCKEKESCKVKIAIGYPLGSYRLQSKLTFSPLLLREIVNFLLSPRGNNWLVFGAIVMGHTHSVSLNIHFLIHWIITEIIHVLQTLQPLVCLPVIMFS